MNELSDVDLRSAYPTAMATIGLPNYSAVRTVSAGDTEAFTAETLGFAEIEFDTPPELRFPVFGVRTERGLIFPRRGITVATAPEIAAARALGCEVVIKSGVIIPWNLSVRPFERFTVKMLNLRERLKGADGKDTLESKAVKEMTNSLYGKTAQGVRARTAYDPQTGGSRQLSPSAVTSPALAAYTTGLTRAAIAELLNGVPSDRFVVSVSTDGFLTSARLEEITLGGPATSAMLAARRRIAAQTGNAPRSDHAELLEVKKRAVEVVAFRNRGIATTASTEGSEPILAKASVKVPRGEDANSFMLRLYLGRDFETRVERQDLISLRDQLKLGADLVSILRRPRVSLEPDMKRRLVRGRSVAIRHGEFAGTEHLQTESEPFDTVEEALAERALFDAWRDGQKRVLQTAADWVAWEDYRAASLARRRTGAGIRVTRDGAAGVLKRQFLRAIVRSMWGIGLNGWTYQDLASWLSERGHPTSVSDVKNATRASAKPAEGAVAVVPASLDLLRDLVTQFPGLELARVFAPGDLAKVEDFLRGMPTR